MKRSLVITILTISLATLTGCDRSEQLIKDPEQKSDAQSAKSERDRVTQLAFEALREYRKTNDQIETLNAYLMGRRKVLLQKEKSDYTERKELSSIYSNSDYEKQSPFSLSERRNYLDREIAVSAVLLREVSYAIREVKKLQNTELEGYVVELFESAPSDRYHLESLSEIHFRIIEHIKTLDGKSDELEQKLNARMTYLKTVSKEGHGKIQELETAIETEEAALTARLKLIERGKVTSTMCAHSILDFAPQRINELKGQIIGAELAVTEIEIIMETIRNLKSSLELKTD